MNCTRFIAIAFLAILGCTCLHADASGGNLVVNPDFESTLPGQHPAGWYAWQKLDGTVFRTVTDQNLAHAGSKCIAMEQRPGNQRNYAVWFQEIPAKPGTTYRYSFWIRTDRVHPLTAYNEDWAASCGTVDFLDSNRKEVQSEPQSSRSASVFMTHDWRKLEISFTTPKEAAYVKVNLALGNAVGTVFFDSVSLAVSPFREVPSPAWLRDAVVYELGPWEFSQFGDGKAFDGIIRKLPELETLGVNLLYLLPVWDDSGWYRITDHFSLFRKYGTEKELKALIDDAHRRHMKVILDLVASGVPLESKLVREHPQWFIHGGDDKLYRSWMELYGLDTNHPDVQQYFVDFAKYYVAHLDVDGYRCDLAMMMHYEMFEKIRNAIQQIKPDAILIAEGSAPVDHETAFDATYDFPFLDRISSLISNPHDAGATIRWLEAQLGFYPPGALHLRYLEGHDLTFTVSSKCGLAGSRAFAALLFTIDGIPMIYNGQEVGNREPQNGWWKPVIDWNGNPDAARYRETYTTLIHIRARYPALRRGSLVAVTAGDERIAAFARVLPGEQTILTVINFSDSILETRLDLAAARSGTASGRSLVDLLDNARLTVDGSGWLALTLKPYQSCVFLLLPKAESAQ